MLLPGISAPVVVAVTGTKEERVQVRAEVASAGPDTLNPIVTAKTRDDRTIVGAFSRYSPIGPELCMPVILHEARFGTDAACVSRKTNEGNEKQCRGGKQSA